MRIEQTENLMKISWPKKKKDDFWSYFQWAWKIKKNSNREYSAPVCSQLMSCTLTKNGRKWKTFSQAFSIRLLDLNINNISMRNVTKVFSFTRYQARGEWQFSFIKLVSIPMSNDIKGKQSFLIVGWIKKVETFSENVIWISFYCVGTWDRFNGFWTFLMNRNAYLMLV